MRKVLVLLSALVLVGVISCGDAKEKLDDAKDKVKKKAEEMKDKAKKKVKDKI